MLERELQRAAREVRALRKQNEVLRRAIRRLLWILEMIREVCNTYLFQAREVLGKSSGVARGEWSYQKGARRVANHIAQLI